jgi:hypothetical protein
MKAKLKDLAYRLFNSTSKIILWTILSFCFYLIIRAFNGWELGLSGAPEIIATIFGVVAIIVTGYTWKAKQENMIKLSQQCKVDDADTLKKIILSEQCDVED